MLSPLSIRYSQSVSSFLYRVLIGSQRTSNSVELPATCASLLSTHWHMKPDMHLILQLSSRYCTHTETHHAHISKHIIIVTLSSALTWVKT